MKQSGLYSNIECHLGSCILEAGLMAGRGTGAKTPRSIMLLGLEVEVVMSLGVPLLAAGGCGGVGW